MHMHIKAVSNPGMLTSTSHVMATSATPWLLPSLAVAPPQSDGSLYSTPSPGCFAARCWRMALRMAAKLSLGEVTATSLNEQQCA